MLLSISAVCSSKKSRLMKKQENRDLITGLVGVKSPFEGIHILGNII